MSPLLTHLRNAAKACTSGYEVSLSIKEIREIVAALEADWQLIATAPKDGTEIFAYIKPTWHDSSPAIGVMLPVCWRDGYWWDRLDRGFGDAVTHWMPMPEPPQPAPLSSPEEVAQFITAMQTAPLAITPPRKEDL